MLYDDAPPPYLSCKLLSPTAEFLPTTIDEDADALWICKFAFAESVPIPILVAVNTPTVVIPYVLRLLTTMFGVPVNPPDVPVALPVKLPTNPPVDVVTPETLSADTTALEIVAAEDTLTSSKVVSPSTSRLPCATILFPNVETPETFKLVANDLVNVPIPDVYTFVRSAVPLKSISVNVETPVALRLVVSN